MRAGDPLMLECTAAMTPPFEFYAFETLTRDTYCTTRLTR